VAAADPWYDYLAIPIAPLVLLAQIGILFLPSRAWRGVLSLACPLAILAMVLYVDSRPIPPDESSVNIGAGVFFLWLVVSVVLLVLALLVELVRHSRAPRFVDE
jgi:hypothetical protein